MVRGKAVDAPGQGAGDQAVPQGVLPGEFGVEEDGLPFDLDHELMRHRALARTGEPVAVHFALVSSTLPESTLGSLPLAAPTPFAADRPSSVTV